MMSDERLAALGNKLHLRPLILKYDPGQQSRSVSKEEMIRALKAVVGAVWLSEGIYAGNVQDMLKGFLLFLP